MHEFEVLVRVLTTLPNYLLIVGDFNVRVEGPKAPGSERLCKLLSDNKLAQNVVGSTHEKGGTLDLVISRSDVCVVSLVSEVGVLHSGIFDHHTVTFSMSIPCPEARVLYKPVRDYSSLDTTRCWLGQDKTIQDNSC